MEASSRLPGPSAVRRRRVMRPLGTPVFLRTLIGFDGQGLILLSKRLERGRFVWPQATSGSVSLTPAQLSMLLEGIDWRMPMRTHEPELAA